MSVSRSVHVTGRSTRLTLGGYYDRSKPVKVCYFWDVLNRHGSQNQNQNNNSAFELLTKWNCLKSNINSNVLFLLLYSQKDLVYNMTMVIKAFKFYATFN